MKTSSCLLLLAGLFTAAASLRGSEIRLLTGDANHQVHNRDSYLHDISADGNLILFSSGPPATGSTPGIAAPGLYIRKISTNTLTFVGDNTVANPGVTYAGFSDDGNRLTWSTGNSGHIYWREVSSNTTRLITQGANGNSFRPYMSADGRYVAYVSFARNLVADTGKLPAAANRAAVLLYDSQTQQTTVASLTHNGSALGTGIGSGAAINSSFNEFGFSKDGRFVIFSSDATNVHPDRTASYPAGFLCIYRRNLQTGEVVLLNKNSSGAIASGNFSAPRISADGGRAVFAGSFLNVFGGGGHMTSGVPAAFSTEIYVKDIPSGAVWWASKTINGAAHDSVGDAFGPVLAIAGNVVSFASTSTKLVTENTDAGGGHTGSFDIFRVELGAAGATTTTLITKSPNGSGNVDYFSGPFMPANGSYVAFCTSQLAAMFGTGNNSSIFFQGIGVGSFPEVETPSALSFSTWASNLPSGKRGYQDNPAGDGVSNLVKYFLGMNAASADTSHLPVQSSGTGASLGLAGDTRSYLTLRFRVRRDLPEGFSWIVNASHDLASLASNPGNAVQVGAPVPDGDFDVYLYRFPTPMTGRGFMNVAFTAP